MEYRDSRNMRGPSGRGRVSKAERRRRQRRKRILQKVIPMAVAVILIVVIIIVAMATGLFEGFMYSSSKADLYSYFGAEDDSSAVVVSNGEITADRIKIKDGHLYCDFDTINSEYNDSFYYQEADDSLLYTTGDGVYKASSDSASYSLNGSSLQAPCVCFYKDGDTIMLSLDYVKLFTDFDYKLYGGGKEPYRVEIKKEWGNRSLADIKKDDMAIRVKADKQADILREMSEGDKVYIVSADGEDWMKVQTEDLITGYIEKKFLSDIYQQMETSTSNVKEITVNKVADYSKPVVLAWHNVTVQGSESYLNDYSSYLDKFNTISPTWFALADNEGTVASLASSEYVRICHEKGLKVWGLVDNMTYPDASTYTVMSDPNKRAKVISQLLSYAAEYNLDGINVDFEMVTQDAGPHFVQFVRELSLEAHKQNLVISVDNYVPKGYTSHYNRKAQGLFADYVIIMGYDEHTSGSEEAGSVASIDFVLDGIEQTLAEVPANEVINALPFYTRYWETSDTGAIVDMQTISMSQAAQTVANAGVKAAWDDATGQNYASWTGGGVTKEIWLEDAQSLRSKLEVMKAQNVGGVAVWQLAYSTSDAWEVIDEFYQP